MDFILLTIVSVAFLAVSQKYWKMKRLYTRAKNKIANYENCWMPRPYFEYSENAKIIYSEMPMVPVGERFHQNYPPLWGIEARPVHTQEDLEELRESWNMIFDELVGDDIQHRLTTRKDK